LRLAYSTVCPRYLSIISGMTDLQISLMAIGGTILIGVVSYNKWQEYKAKKSVERAFSSTPDDVLMTPAAPVAAPPSGGRQEPTFTASDEAIANTEASLAVESDHDEVANTAAIVPPPPPRQKELPVDGLIDCVVPLMLDSPVRGEKVLTAIQSLRHVGNKPVHFIGQREDGTWDVITHGAAYTALQAGIQLANRHGALNELEYSEFVNLLRQMADALDAEPDLPDMNQVIATARELSQFVNEYYAQLSVNVVSKGAPWDINTLLAALERQGFDLRPDGRLVMPDGDGGILFSLSTNVTLASETTSRLTLLLDVPCVAQSNEGFNAMVACARMLAGRLDGVVVDDGNQPLSESALKEISDQVATFYSHMDAAEVPAGSIRALRLFG
jgi:hypothetical protein